jgi:subtilase family serine protease
MSISAFVILLMHLFAIPAVHAQTSSPFVSSQVKPVDPLFLEAGNKRTRHEAVCPKPKSPDEAQCFSQVIVENTATPFVSAKPAGFGPVEFRNAYNVSGKTSQSPVVAIIDAYDQPNMLSDLQTYSTTFNLPQLSNCSGTILKAAVPCFKKVDQNGGTAYPKTDSGWAMEISLDVEAVHAMCDNCKILLVEAKTASNADLLKAVDMAVNLGATIISNSYGSDETPDETSSDSHFNKPGIAILASSGDSGYGVSYPAASRYVVAVGGTKLTLKTGAYSSESAWTDGGSGCSAYETKPVWQKDKSCPTRIVADIAADADPTSGSAVYDSFPFSGKKGWFKLGGTSLASPLVAGIFALSPQLPNVQAGSFLYGLSASHFHDITKGKNGTCTPSYFCKAAKGYDGPTGLGSPAGVL